MSHTGQLSPLRILLPLFLAGISLLLSALIFSEIFLSYYAKRIAPTPSSLPPQYAHAMEVLHRWENLEWHVRAHSSALAFGGFIFVWYQIFIALFQIFIRLWRYCADGNGGGERSTGCRNDQCPELHCRTSIFSSYYVGFLLAAIILNDSIYNRCRNSASVGCCSSVNSTLTLSEPLFPPSYSTIVSSLVFIQKIFPDSFARFSSMATRSLPICAAEVSVLFLVLYGVGILFPDTAFTSNSIASSSRPNSRSGPLTVAVVIRLPEDKSTNRLTLPNPDSSNHSTSFLHSDIKEPSSVRDLECVQGLAQWALNPSDKPPTVYSKSPNIAADVPRLVPVDCTKEVRSHDDEKNITRKE